MHSWVERIKYGILLNDTSDMVMARIQTHMTRSSEHKYDAMDPMAIIDLYVVTNGERVSLIL